MGALRLASRTEVYAPWVTRVALLSGGTGGAKLAHGFQQVLDPGELTVIVNVADDLELFGLHVSPDVDSVLYTLAGLVDPVRGWGVAGILWSDLAATTVFSASLLPILVRHARPALDRASLREVLAFGLPKVPHGFLVQVLNVSDRKILDLFVTRAEVGLYQTGYTFGTAVKFALSAFEPAWSPFVYGQLKKDGARETLARVVTYAFAAFVGVALAVAVLGRELLVLMTPRNPAFRAAA